MRNLSELNIEDDGWPDNRPPLSDEDVREFEEFFKLRLPDDYVTLLRHANGGCPELAAFLPKGLKEGGLRGINHFYYLTADRNEMLGLWRETRVWQEVTSPHIVPIGENGGGDQIVLDCGSEPPSVKLCLHDEDYEMIDVADSFGEFIDMLCEDPDMI